MFKLLWSLLFVGILFRISYTDLKYCIIGKWETGILLGMGMLFYWVPFVSEWHGGILSGLFLAGLVELANYVCFRFKGIGGGDVRLIFVMGLVFGGDRGLRALFMALVMALVVMVFAYVIYKPEGDSIRGAAHRCMGRDGIKKRRIPLGPFLTAGFLVQLACSFWL